MVVAVLALAVAAGGVGYAAIPDNDGTIHACYKRTSGDLRVVESPRACRNSELPLAWNREGPPGPAGAVVVTRMRGGPATFGPGSGSIDVPLTNSSWTQGANQLQELAVEFRTSGRCSGNLSFVLDGRADGSRTYVFGSGPSGDDRTRFDIPLLESGAQQEHTLAVRFSGSCTASSITFDYVRADVVGFE
jgi:hypothetical protein